MEVKLQKMLLLIIEEISMVWFHGLPKVNDVVCRIKKVSFKWFWQCLHSGCRRLTPVGTSCWTHCVPQTPQKPEDLAPILWHNFKIHELTEMMWQKDKEFAAMLNAVCIKVTDEHSNEDLMLHSCELKIECSHEDYPFHAMHV